MRWVSYFCLRARAPTLTHVGSYDAIVAKAVEICTQLHVSRGRNNSHIASLMRSTAFTLDAAGNCPCVFSCIDPRACEGALMLL
jgi:hypothetical protein